MRTGGKQLGQGKPAMRKGGGVLVIFLPVILLGINPALGQDPRGRILGRVRDVSGAVVPGARVTAIHTQTEVNIGAEANELGNYQLLYLNPGYYRIVVEHPGFKRFERPNIEVRVGDAITLDITLEPGQITESITVTAETPLLEASEASVGQLVDRRRLADLPLAGGNPAYLLQLTPGIISLNASTHGWFPHAHDSWSNIAAVGTRSRSNQFALDGNPIMTQNGMATYSPPLEMVQEMKIQTAPFDASQGGFSGATFNIVTRGGTNEWHGDLWFSHYSRPLMTRNFFVNRFIFDPNTGPITEEKKNSQWPPTQTNRYRATVSGPIVRSRTFFIYGWDKLFRKRPVTGTNTVPTVRQRAGDFSELLALGSRYQIYDPATIAPAPGGRFSRQPLPGNIIPASRIDPVAKRLLDFYPLPNSTENPEGRNNFIAPVGTKIDYYSHSVRVDHVFREKHRLFVSFSWSDLEEPANRRFPGIIAVGHVQSRDHRGVSLDDVYVLSPRTFLNVRYGMTRFPTAERPDSLGYDLASLGFAPRFVALLEREQTIIPNITIQGLQALSRDNGYSTVTNYHFLTGNVTHTRGNHSLRFGGETRVFQENRYSWGNYTPAIDFQTTWTRGPLDNSPAAPIGQGLASFLLGLPTGGGRDDNPSVAQQSRFAGLYFQDDWKLTSRLTLNLGLRYELETPITERYNRSTRGFDFHTPNPIEEQARANYARSPIPELPVSEFRTLGGLLFAGVGGVPRGLWDTDKSNFAPRFGIAWQMTPKTVWRGGYGIFYELNGATRNDVGQQGFAQRTNLNPSLDNGLTFRATLADPFPDGFLKPAGAANGLRTFLGRSTSFSPPSLRNGYMQRWSLGLQRELPWRWMLETSYVGNRGSLLNLTRAVNFVPARWLSRSPVRDQPVIDFLTANVRNPFAGIAEFAGSALAGANVPRSQLLRPFPHFVDLSTLDDVGYSWYHSLQVRLEKRFARGFTMHVSYTWSKFMEAVEFLNDSDPVPYEVISPQDRPQHIALTAIYELPFGRGRALLSGARGWLEHLVGGWQVQAIYQGQSGPPLGFGNIIFYGNIKDVTLPVGRRKAERWFNIDAGFERDSAKQLANNIRAFPPRFNDIRGDGFNQWDLSLFKNIRIRERLRLQLRAEAQNALNHAMFAAPNTTPTSTLFGQVSATQFPEQRRISMAAKLSF